MKNYNVIAVITLIFISLFSNKLSAQCAEIYFYRFNNLQSDTRIYLFHEGEKIATVRKGDRYKATVCSEGAYEFFVKTNEDNLSMIKTKVDVKNGGNYYVKIGISPGIEVATISKKSSSKGQKDFNKGSKFKGDVQDLTLKNAPVTVQATSKRQYQNPSSIANGQKSFKQSQVVGNFQFDVVEVVKAGDMLSMALKVTNLTSEDLILYSSYYNIYFYDDMGNLLSANDLCIVNDCDYGNSTIDKIQTHHYSRTKSLIPYGIPMNMNVNVRGIKNGSKKLARGVFQMGFYNPDTPGHKTAFDLEYFNIEYPNVTDPNQPEKRIFGSKSIKFLDAKKDEKNVVAAFEFQNNGIQPVDLQVKSATAYDEFGNEYKYSDVAFASGSDWKRHIYSKQSVNNNSKTKLFIKFPNVKQNAQRFIRIKLNLYGFTFEWNGKNLLGEGAVDQHAESNSRLNISNTSSRVGYLTYNDFEKKANNKENVIGKKVILENIYFNSGSDEILKKSYPQLDQLAQLMQANQELKVEISGHTDNVGEDLPNMLLSQKRADSIKYYLIAKSVNPGRISSVGKGKNEPISNNTSESGRKENRRVEVLVVQ